VPFRPAFDCLWCGRPWTTRSPDDLEGWAQLCPDCLGRAGDNPFLRARLRAAIAERGRAPAGARAADDDDWYRRRGRYSHGPVHDTAWEAELDAAGRWLDALPIAGRIVELDAGTGWWSPLLASKGELTAYDAAPGDLDRARDRLLAHGLRAHLHVRDAWAEPEGDPADALFTAFMIGHIEGSRLPEFLVLARRWLRPGGRLASIDVLPDPASGARDELVPVHVAPDELRSALTRTGFDQVGVTTTGRFFLLATGVAG